MKEKPQMFTLDELASLVDLPKRSIRYYIQIELIDRPGGFGRGAHYSTRHLEQLVEVRKWQQAGLSLDRIRELLTVEKSEAQLPPPRPSKKGVIEVRSHIMVDEGIELIIDPKCAELTPEKVREFANDVMKLYEKICTRKECDL